MAARDACSEVFERNAGALQRLHHLDTAHIALGQPVAAVRRDDPQLDETVDVRQIDARSISRLRARVLSHGHRLSRPAGQWRGVGPGRAYVQHRLAAGSTKTEALRLLRRRLSDEVYRRMRSALRTRSRTVTWPHDVRLAEAQLGRILDRDEPLGVRDERREHVQQRGLSRSWRRPTRSRWPCP